MISDTPATPAFLSGLNDRQLEAVTLPHQSALILAGAGSGKTRVLTTRMAWLIQTGQISPMNLLAVTFTNKAAKEMLMRMSAMLPINTRGMWVGTFHGLCNRLLRSHYREAGLPQLFQILDTQDQLALIKRLMRAMNVDEERYPPRQAQWFIAGSKDEGKRADKVVPHDDFSRRMVEFYAEYDRQCQREGVVDFAELLLRAYELLARNENLREHYALTLKQWCQNLEDHWDEAVAEAGLGTARVWRLYMAASRLGFELNTIQLHQMLGVKLGDGAVSGMPLRPNFGPGGGR